jgi:hypothetical protein
MNKQLALKRHAQLSQSIRPLLKEDGEASGKPMVLRFEDPSAQWSELNEGSLIMPLRR